MRTSELIALRWGDIDWNRRAATVRHAQVRHEEKGTKTHQVRDVGLNDLAPLIAQKPHSFMRGPDAVIFYSPEGKRWLSKRRLRVAFFKALMASVNPSYIARQLGHANTAMLFKHYATWIEGADQGAEAAKLNKALGAELAPNLSPANTKPLNPRT